MRLLHNPLPWFSYRTINTENELCSFHCRFRWDYLIHWIRGIFRRSKSVISVFNLNPTIICISRWTARTCETEDTEYIHHSLKIAKLCDFCQLYTIYFFHLQYGKPITYDTHRMLHNIYFPFSSLKLEIYFKSKIIYHYILHHTLDLREKYIIHSIEGRISLVDISPTSVKLVEFSFCSEGLPKIV